MQLHLGHVSVDLNGAELISRCGKRAAITTRELAVLKYLVERSGTDVARSEIERDVFGLPSHAFSRALDVTVSRLRRKLEVDALAPRHLVTAHGTGYRWVPPRADGWGVPAPSSGPSASALRLTDRTLDLERGVVELQGDVTLPLTPAERFLLERLAEVRKPVDAQALVAGQVARSAAVERVAKVVHRLRRKLEVDPRQPRHLVHLRGAGYRLHAEPLHAPTADRLKGVAFAISRHAGTVLGFEDVVVYVREGDVLRQIAAYGPKNPDGEVLLNPLVLPVGRGIVGAAAALNATQCVTNTLKDRRYVPDAVPGLSELAVPVRLGGKVVGVLDSEHPAPNAFRAEHRRAFESMGDVLAATLGAMRAP